MKNYADLRGCYPPKPKHPPRSHNSSYHTRRHPIIVNYSQFIDRIVKEGLCSWELAIVRRALASERHRLQVKTLLYIFLCVTTR